MIVRKFAAIDIGSNAIRLLIHNVIEHEDRETRFKKSSLIRIPIRLGQDAFILGEISQMNVQRMIKGMKAFKLLMEINGVEDYMACATSAMREAKNGQSVIKQIAKESDVHIELIDGKKEAEIIASTDLKEFVKNDNSYLYVDVGGGSTEFTVFSSGKIIASKSFKIGTVRLLNDLVDQKIWDELKSWIVTNTANEPKIAIIGTGGNINKLHKMSLRKVGQPLSYIWLNAQYHFLNSMSYDDRVSELGLNQDRADVILPAARIFLSAAKWSNSKKIHVPKIGLSDGIIKVLYDKRRKRSQTNRA